MLSIKLSLMFVKKQQKSLPEMSLYMASLIHLWWLHKSWQEWKLYGKDEWRGNWLTLRHFLKNCAINSSLSAELFHCITFGLKMDFSFIICLNNLSKFTQIFAAVIPASAIFLPRSRMTLDDWPDKSLRWFVDYRIVHKESNSMTVNHFPTVDG